MRSFVVKSLFAVNGSAKMSSSKGRMGFPGLGSRKGAFLKSDLLEVETVLFDVINCLVVDTMVYVVILWVVGLVA